VAGALVIGGLVAGLTLEGLLRIGARGLSPAALGAWEERRPWEAIRERGPNGEPRPIPGGQAAWRIQPWHRPIEYRLDGNGFRTGGGALRAAPASAPCRILALGDSHTFGYGVGALDAWPAVLESMLAQVAVANGGLCGSGIAATQSWLPDALEAARPHVVVLAMTPWSLREDPEAPVQHELDGRWPRAEAYLRRVTRYSAVADRLTRAMLLRSSAWFGWPPPAPMLWELTPLVEPRARFHERWRAMHVRLAEMVRLVRRRGATPIIMLIPLDIQVSAERNVLYRTGRLPYRTHGFVDRDYTRDDRYVRALDKTANGLRVPFIDTTPMLRALAPAGFLPDTYHLSAEGHAHLAALLTGPLVHACADVPSVVEAALGRPATTSVIPVDARM
jgi:lysophospholipase L1-like esterase